MGLPAFAKTHKRQHAGGNTSSTTSSSKGKKGKKGKPAKGAWKRHGQQQIDSDRTREIQTALIREHYLDGEPTGSWDDRTRQAFVKLQSEQGWQTKVVPDSRALIKLGLGPKHDNDLNTVAGVSIGKSAESSGAAQQ
jgi:hypothetical protein